MRYCQPAQLYVHFEMSSLLLINNVVMWSTRKSLYASLVNQIDKDSFTIRLLRCVYPKQYYTVCCAICKCADDLTYATKVNLH